MHFLQRVFETKRRLVFSSAALTGAPQASQTAPVGEGAGAFAGAFGAGFAAAFGAGFGAGPSSGGSVATGSGAGGSTTGSTTGTAAAGAAAAGDGAAVPGFPAHGALHDAAAVVGDEVFGLTVASSEEGEGLVEELDERPDVLLALDLVLDLEPEALVVLEVDRDSDGQVPLRHGTHQSHIAAMPLINASVEFPVRAEQPSRARTAVSLRARPAGGPGRQMMRVTPTDP